MVSVSSTNFGFLKQYLTVYSPGLPETPYVDYISLEFAILRIRQKIICFFSIILFSYVFLCSIYLGK